METSRVRIVARLRSEGWFSEGGTKHEKFTRHGSSFPIIVPRHRDLSIGVARAIAKQAGWA